MKNFEFYSPTKVIFGKDILSQLGTTIRLYGKKVLLVYGKNSIKATGLYEKVTALCRDAGISLIEYSGVEPNPKLPHAEAGAKMAVEAHRRKMPYCMGSLYWQLNDCWPVSSWSSIDYFGRWKAVHYFAKKAFNNILISPTINDDKLKVFIVSDLLKPLSAKMIIEVMDFSGKKMWQKTIPVEVKANTSHCYFTENVKKIINGLDKNKIFLRTIVMNNDQPLSQNIFYFLSIKNLNLPAPKIEKTITAKKNGFRIRLSSLELAKNIYLSIDDTKGFFTDNYFDLLPGEVVEVDFSNKGDAEYFKENLKIVSLRNSYQ